MKSWRSRGVVFAGLVVIAMGAVIGVLANQNHDLGQQLAAESRQNAFLNSLLDDRDREISALEADRRTLQAAGLIMAWEYEDMEREVGHTTDTFVLDTKQVKRIFTTHSPVSRSYGLDPVEATVPNIYQWTKEPTRGNIANVRFLENGQGTVYGTEVGTTWSTKGP